MSLEFNTAVRRKEPIQFILDGEEFTFTPPKQAHMVLQYLDEGDDVGALLDWLEEGLSEEQAKRIADRLRDADDDLDIDQINNIVISLLEKVTGRPLHRRSNSLRGQSRRGRR